MRGSLPVNADDITTALSAIAEGKSRITEVVLNRRGTHSVVSVVNIDGVYYYAEEISGSDKHGHAFEGRTIYKKMPSSIMAESGRTSRQAAPRNRNVTSNNKIISYNIENAIDGFAVDEKGDIAELYFETYAGSAFVDRGAGGVFLLTSDRSLLENYPVERPNSF